MSHGPALPQRESQLEANKSRLHTAAESESESESESQHAAVAHADAKVVSQRPEHGNVSSGLRRGVAKVRCRDASKSPRARPRGHSRQRLHVDGRPRGGCARRRLFQCARSARRVSSARDALSVFFVCGDVSAAPSCPSCPSCPICPFPRFVHGSPYSRPAPPRVVCVAVCSHLQPSAAIRCRRHGLEDKTPSLLSCLP